MQVRNQVRRSLWSGYHTIFHRTRTCGTAQGHHLKKGSPFSEGDDVLQKILNAKRNGEGTFLWPSRLQRYTLSSRNAYSSKTPLFPKSTTSEVPPDENSCQTSRESRLRNFFTRLPSAANFHGEARRGTQECLGVSFWQRMFYPAGAGAAAAVLLVGAVAAVRYEEGSHSRPDEVLLSTWSILWESLVEFNDKMTLLLRDGVGDIVQAAAAATILIRCVISVLLTVGEEPTVGLSSWLMPGVAALVADLVAHENRRKAVVEAGGGRVLDWLLKSVGNVDPGVNLATQAEASRALAHLLSDENSCEAVLSRPHALPYLFQFASFLHDKQGLQDWKKGREVHLDGGNSTGRSMLVSAIVDLFTSGCDVEDGSGIRPKLPGNADSADIAAALQVIKNGGWLLDDQDRNDGDADGKAANNKGGVNGIGIRVLGGTGIVGIQRVILSSIFNNCFVCISPERPTKPPKHERRQESFILGQRNHASLAFTGTGPKQSWGFERAAFAECHPKKYGLWDDLQGQHITVPLAAWALAMWARASNGNRVKIAEQDENGEALLAAVLAAEKTVKWHGAMAMRSLLASKNYSLATDVAPRWSSALLNVAAQAGRLKDPSLAHCALAALTSCVSRSKYAQTLVLQEGLPVMRGIAGESEGNTPVQGALAQLLDALTDEGENLPGDESKKWASILLKWVCHLTSDNITRSCGSRVLARVVNNLGVRGIPVTQAWLAMLLMEVISDGRLASAKGKKPGSLIAEAKEREQLQNQVFQKAIVAAAQLGKVVAQEAAYKADTSDTDVEVAESAAELPMIDLLGLDVMGNTSKPASKEALPKVTATEAAVAVQRAIKALTELTAEDPVWRQRILEAGVMCLLRRFLLCNDYEQWATSEESEMSSSISHVEQDDGLQQKKGQDKTDIALSVCPHIRKHAARLLAVLSLQSAASEVIAEDEAWVTWLEDCANGQIAGSIDNKIRSYALTALLNVSSAQSGKKAPRLEDGNHDVRPRVRAGMDLANDFWPRYEDAIFILNTGSQMWKAKLRAREENRNEEVSDEVKLLSMGSLQTSQAIQGLPSSPINGVVLSGKEAVKNEPVMDVIFIHGLRGGPFKTWRIADSKTSTTTPLVERIDVEAGKKGTCWPDEWLGSDLPRSRLLSVKYKTNLSEWSGATLPLQEVSSMLLDKLLAAGVGERPLVFVTHSMGGLVVKQMLLQAGSDETRAHLLNHTTGVVFYSCPHFGSKLADMPWRIGYVLRPAPSIGELRSGSPRLEELNRRLRHLHKEGHLDVLSFSETKVTPLVEGYGGWGLRMEVVPIESAYPGFGELVALPGTDHVNSCKPLDRADPAYTKTLEFLQNLELYAAGVSEQD